MGLLLLEGGSGLLIESGGRLLLESGATTNDLPGVACLVVAAPSARLTIAAPTAYLTISENC